jgi:hypothetical protein
VAKGCRRVAVFFSSARTCEWAHAVALPCIHLQCASNNTFPPLVQGEARTQQNQPLHTLGVACSVGSRGPAPKTAADETQWSQVARVPMLINCFQCTLVAEGLWATITTVQVKQMQVRTARGKFGG